MKKRSMLMAKSVSRFIQILALFFFCVETATLQAIPLNNPCDASLLQQRVFCPFYFRGDPPSVCQAWSLRVGYQGGFVFNRHMTVDRDEDDSTIHATRLATNAGLLVLNFWNKLDFFTTLGATHLDFKTPASTFSGSVNNRFLTVDSNTHFSWSLGARGTLWHCRGWCLGAEAVYFQTRPHLNSLHLEGEAPFYFHSDNRLIFREWLLGIGLSSCVPIGCTMALVPYAGICLTHAKLRMETVQVPLFGITLFNLQSNVYLGWAFGLTLVGCSKASVSVEGRFRDEKALYLNAQFRL